MGGINWFSVVLTFEFTRVRKRAKPAVARRVERRVSGTSHYLYFAAVMN